MTVPNNEQLAVRAKSRPLTRSQAAVAMRIKGYSYDEIAHALEFRNEDAARTATMDSLAKTADEDDRIKHRILESRRYEALLQAVMPAALDPEADNHIVAQRQAKDLIDRLVALHGAAAAQEILVKTPASKELAAFVAAVTAGSTPDVHEVDPFGEIEDGKTYDAEIVEN